MADRELQIAVDAAYTLLLIDAARTYGLIDDRLNVDIAQCNTLLEKAKAQGVKPSRGNVEINATVLVFPGAMSR